MQCIRRVESAQVGGGGSSGSDAEEGDVLELGDGDR